MTGFKITICVSCLDDALDIYGKVLSHVCESNESTASLIFENKGEKKILSFDKLKNRDELYGGNPKIHCL